MTFNIPFVKFAKLVSLVKFASEYNKEISVVTTEVCFCKQTKMDHLSAWKY